MSSWFNENGNGSRVDVAELLDGLNGQGIRELVEAGALVSLGLTSDGGALGVTVTVDGTWKRDYFRKPDELGLWIAGALPAVHEMRGTGVPPAHTGRAPRRSRTR